MGRNTRENFRLFKVNITSIHVAETMAISSWNWSYDFPEHKISQSQGGLVIGTLNRRSGDLGSSSGSATFQFCHNEDGLHFHLGPSWRALDKTLSEYFSSLYDLVLRLRKHLLHVSQCDKDYKRDPWENKDPWSQGAYNQEGKSGI